MTIKILPDKVKKFILNYSGIITTDSVLNQFKISRRTASNYLSRLNNDGLISRIERGKYIVSQNSNLKPEIPIELENIHQLIKKNSPYLEFVIWSIFNFKRFYHYIPSQNYIFIEAKEMFELKAIKERLFESAIESIINPDKKDFEELMYRNKTPVFLFKRKNDYGIINIKGIQTPNLERCVIDLYFYITKVSFSYPLQEVRLILTNLIKTKQFNFSFANRYTKMRNIEFEFYLIFLKLSEILPNFIPKTYLERNSKIRKNLKLFFGEDWYRGIF